VNWLDVKVDNFSISSLDTYVPDLEATISMEALPNPVTEQLSIRLDASVQVQSIRLVSLDGKVAVSFERSLRQLDVSSMPRGQYVLELVTDRGRVNRQLVLH